MTYCVGMRLNSGLVFLSDSRTNAGVDHIGSFRKMTLFENPGDRIMVLLTAGNLSISQSIRQTISEYLTPNGTSIWTASSMYEAAQIVGDSIRSVHKRDAESLEQFGIDFNVSLVFGGQIRGERCRLFQMYSAGNFIESHDENPYFQIGESKYGKPIIDRVITPDTPLDEAAKCALISMDSTLRSNISVGFPLDLLLYDENALTIGRFVTIDEKNQYFQMLRGTWGKQLRSVFEGIADPVWNAAPEATSNVLSSRDNLNQPARIVPPASIARTGSGPAPLQTLAQGGHNKAQY
ncbi:MAG: proteasome-type protease [Oxalobacteraceae bacterium]|jgi:putative proteasome-type protease|nr:proteasome-type protease [Oxalobacteraceae bacterium]